MRPLISYYGGKQRMASKIVPLIPPHTVYCEPFAGGAAVFYAKPQPKSVASEHYREVLNDLNGDLVNFYMVAKSESSLLAQTIDSLPFSAKIHKKSQGFLGSSLEKAAGFYINIQQSFTHVLGGGWQRGVYSQNHADTFNRRKQYIKDGCGRLSAVYLDNVDAIKCIQQWDSPQTFFYVDPPYLGTNLGHMGQWAPSDLRRLVDCLNMARGSFIVSGYSTDSYHLRGCVAQEFKAHCSADRTGRTGIQRNHKESIKSEGKDRTEVIWMRGPAAPVRKSLIPILQKQTCFTGPLLGPCPLPLAR